MNKLRRCVQAPVTGLRQRWFVHPILS